MKNSFPLTHQLLPHRPVERVLAAAAMWGPFSALSGSLWGSSSLGDASPQTTRMLFHIYSEVSAIVLNENYSKQPECSIPSWWWPLPDSNMTAPSSCDSPEMKLQPLREVLTPTLNSWFRIWQGYNSSASFLFFHLPLGVCIGWSCAGFGGMLVRWAGACWAGGASVGKTWRHTVWLQNYQCTHI